jgi:hypothetical protein
MITRSMSCLMRDAIRHASLTTFTKFPEYPFNLRYVIWMRPIQNHSSQRSGTAEFSLRVKPAARDPDTRNVEYLLRT